LAYWLAGWIGSLSLVRLPVRAVLILSKGVGFMGIEMGGGPSSIYAGQERAVRETSLGHFADQQAPRVQGQLRLHKDTGLIDLNGEGLVF
jgi:hypothetical protein